MADNLLPCPFCGGEARVWMPEHPLNADCGDAKVSCSDCDADGPVIGLDMDVHTLADWPGLEAEAIAAWNRRPAPETGFLGHLVVPKSGVGAVFIGKGEPVPLMGDKGRVVPVYDGPQNVTANDPMEAVAWRWRWPDTNKWHYADYNLHPEAEEVQALAVIPVQGGEG